MSKHAAAQAPQSEVDKSAQAPQSEVDKSAETPQSEVDKSAETIKARVLVDHGGWKVGQVVEVPSDQLASYAGVLDADPAAVSYAQSIAA